MRGANHPEISTHRAKMARIMYNKTGQQSPYSILSTANYDELMFDKQYLEAV